MSENKRYYKVTIERTFSYNASIYAGNIYETGKSAEDCIRDNLKEHDKIRESITKIEVE